jgi:hypothetical protein
MALFLIYITLLIKKKVSRIYQKRRRGAAFSTQGVYKGGLEGRGEEREKIRKTNHPWGQPACCPGAPH